MIGNFQHRTSHQGLMTQSALITPVYISNRRLQNMNCIYEPTEKMGGLFLGDVISTLKVDLLQQHQIRAVLSCMNDRVSLPVMLTHKILPIQDTVQYPIKHFFDQAAEWIDAKRREGHNVLVHCHAGVSRSATIVVSYLMRFKNWTAHQALSYVRLRRQRAKPNAGFWNQLLQYQNKLAKITLPAPLAENLTNNQPQFSSPSSKEYFRTPERHSEQLSSENQYQIRVITPRNLESESATLRNEKEKKQEPKSHTYKRKRIFDQEHYLHQNNSQSRRYEVLSTEPNPVQSFDGKKFSHSIIFPNQRDHLTNVRQHLSEDPFRETKSALEYRINSNEQPRSPHQAIRYNENQGGLTYVSPFEVGGYRKMP